MARSLKKGPFIDESLMKKIQKLNAENKKEVVILTQDVQLYSLTLLVIL